MLVSARMPLELLKIRRSVEAEQEAQSMGCSPWSKEVCRLSFKIWGKPIRRPAEIGLKAKK
jgi:hypothetical protein